MSRATLALIMLPAALPATLAQTPAAFEVASVRPGSASVRIHTIVDDSQVDFGSYPLIALIQFGYRVPGDYIKGPSWLSDRFDVKGKLPAGTTKDQAPAMMQTLLAERFKLAVHHELRSLDVYLLTVAKDGPKFRESPMDDSVRIPCNGGFRKICHKESMTDLAAMLTNMSQMAAVMSPESRDLWIDRPVVDESGLKGAYDFTMDFGAAAGGRGGATGPAVPEGTTRSVMDAVKDLGLKLEPTKHEFDYLVIDHVERVPTDN